MESKVYNQEGKEVGKVGLPESVFNVPWNDDLVHQVVVSQEANKRTGTAHTKDRSEVSGGGKKPWRQKGTGRARHGSIRSPLWRTGGVTFGPRKEKDYSKKINKKVKAKALYTVLSQKLKDGEIVFVDEFLFNEPKSKQARETLKSLSKITGLKDLPTKRKNAALVVLGTRNENAVRSFQNFPSIDIEEVRNINTHDVLRHKYLLISHPKDSVAVLEKRLAQVK
jgi:large subunit ribosomal protein L4|tara:strand:+ start:24160 stop:24831 length:672 start_codon:yes stop_codon:yes gene_type:complete